MAARKTYSIFSTSVAILIVGIAILFDFSPLNFWRNKNEIPSRSVDHPSNVGFLTNEIGQQSINNSVKVWFSIHANGDGLSEGIKLNSTNFKDIDDIIFKYCCGIMKQPEEKCLPNSGARLISESGVRLLSFNDVEDGQRVYCVPQGLHFVWPLRKTGYTFYPKNVVAPIPGKPIRMKQLTENPRVFSVENFVTVEEMEEILRVNRDKLKRSGVGFKGRPDDNIRTSSTAWDTKSKSGKLIQIRTLQLLGMDVDFEAVNSLQVLRYSAHGLNGTSEWYKPHVDYFRVGSYPGSDPTVNNGTNRFATMFLYMSDVAKGGATVFPLSTTHEGYNGEKLVRDGTVNTPGMIDMNDAIYCCNDSSTALRSPPRQGNAVLFYSQGPDGTLDPYSLHGGCPPLEGDKWSANLWVWNRNRVHYSKDTSSTSKTKRSVIFRNNDATSTGVDIYWDSKSSGNARTEELGEIQKLFHADQSSGFARFRHMGKIGPNEVKRWSSIVGHVFISVDSATNEVLSIGSVEEFMANTEDEKDPGLTLYVGRQ